MFSTTLVMYSTTPVMYLAFLLLFSAVLSLKFYYQLGPQNNETLQGKPMMTELSREIGEVWARLFDHRPFLNGEIKFMLKEFEERRGDREVENLFSILEKLTDIKDTQVDKIKKGSETALPVLGEKLDQALQLCEGVETDYLEIQKACEQKRAENREKRQKEWDQFIDDMNYKCQRIDNAFEEKEEELRDLYADLNHKLNIAK